MFVGQPQSASAQSDECGAKLKELYGSVNQKELTTCVSAYNIVKASSSKLASEATSFCNNQTGSDAAKLASVCSAGATLAEQNLASGTVSKPAATASSGSVVGASTRCSIKINRDGCEAAAKKCKKSSTTNPENAGRCEATVANSYPDVYKVCQTKADPQECHKVVKKANCGSKPTAAEQKACKAKAAAPLANPKAQVSETFTFGEKTTANGQCGKGPAEVETRFDFGCLGEDSPEDIGPIEDLAYALIRFLTAGIGLVMVASIVYAGVQYASSEGNPEATVAAKKRIQNALIGLIFYIFIFALVQYLVPGGLFA